MVVVRGSQSLGPSKLKDNLNLESQAFCNAFASNPFPTFHFSCGLLRVTESVLCCHAFPTGSGYGRSQGKLLWAGLWLPRHSETVVRALRVKVALGKCSLEQLSLLVREENWRKQDSVQEPSRQPATSPGSLDRAPWTQLAQCGAHRLGQAGFPASAEWPLTVLLCWFTSWLSWPMIKGVVYLAFWGTLHRRC